jgi:hypothetical protein
MIIPARNPATVRVFVMSMIDWLVLTAVSIEIDRVLRTGEQGGCLCGRMWSGQRDRASLSHALIRLALLAARRSLPKSTAYLLSSS